MHVQTANTIEDQPEWSKDCLTTIKTKVKTQSTSHAIWQYNCTTTFFIGFRCVFYVGDRISQKKGRQNVERRDTGNVYAWRHHRGMRRTRKRRWRSTARYNADTHDGPRSQTASRIRNGVSPLMFPNKCVVPKYASLILCGSEVCFGRERQGIVYGRVSCARFEILGNNGDARVVTEPRETG